MEKYDVKILVVLLKTIEGRKDFFKWLLNNGYPELAAFSNAIRGDRSAQDWLVKYDYGWLAVLSEAIDGDTKARIWISKHCHKVNLMFALACRQEEQALKWLALNRLQIFLLLAKQVSIVLDTQASENAGPYVMHF